MTQNILKTSLLLVLFVFSACKENVQMPGLRVKVDLSKLSHKERSALSIPAVCFFINVRDLQAPRIRTPNTVAADQSADCLGFETVSDLVTPAIASTAGISLSMTGSNFDQKIELYGVLGMPCGSSSLLGTVNAASQIYLFKSTTVQAQSQEVVLAPTETTIDRNDRLSVCRNNNRRSIGGTVTGVAAGSVNLVLQNNGGDNINIPASGTFSFPTALLPGENYNVSVFTQPTGQYCSVQNGTGVVTATTNVTNIQVKCANANTVLQGLTLTTSTNSFNVGDTFNLSAMGYFRDGSTSNQTAAVTWSTSSASTASVTATGEVTILSTGTFTITAAQTNVLGETITGTKTIGITNVASLTVSNLNSTGNVHRLIETGYIVGASSGISTLGVQYDSNSITTFAATPTWSFALPQGSSTWRLGTNHIIKIGAANAAGFIGTPQTFYVRKGNNRDFNGDGYVDVVVASPATDSVFLFLSQGATGLLAAGSASIEKACSTANVTLTGVAGDSFGGALAVADFNADGYADLVVGSPLYSAGSLNNRGRVMLYLSSTTNTPPTISTSTNPIFYYGGAAGYYFGDALAAGDINGDGYADMVVGASGTNKTYIHYTNTTNGIPASATYSTLYPGGSNMFGSALAVGNLDGNNYADLVVGAPNENTAYDGRTYTSAGKIFVYYSTTSFGIVDSANPSATKEGTSQYAYLGSTLAIGNLDNAYNDDLVSGAPGDGSANGSFAEFYFSTASTLDLTASNQMTSTPGAYVDKFGSSLAIGDLNGDGYSDLVVGAVGHTDGTNANLGAAYVYHYSTPSPFSTYTKRITGIEAGGYLGNALSISDINGDGYSDLLVAAKGAQTSARPFSNAGIVSVYHTSSSGLGTTPVASTVLKGNTNNQNFGYVVK